MAIHTLLLCGGALKLSDNGDIIYKDKLLVNDSEIVQAFRDAFKLDNKEKLEKAQ